MRTKIITKNKTVQPINCIMIVSFGPLSIPFQLMKVYVVKIDRIKRRRKLVKDIIFDLKALLL